MSVLLETQGLTRRFQVSQGMFAPKATLHALNGVDLRLNRGEVLGIVGESGCGKSTLAKILLNLLAPSEGSVRLDGRDIGSIGRLEFTRRVQPVFQDPFSSLNPRKTIADIVTMPLRVHAIGTEAERRARTAQIMDMVGLPARFAERYPKELSGGQRQRVAI
uniref:ATP-binding cassette domain-containing protein n=1 Tax=Falsirhodobacter xinxiangensis TaxID=2530049 RepID=UPI0010AA8E2E